MGQTRVSSYYKWLPIPERVALEAEVVRRCFSRSELQCSFFEFRGYKIIYRRYASLFFIVGVDSSDAENELGILEFIHCLVETLLADTQHFTSAALITLPVSMWQAYQQAGARCKLRAASAMHAQHNEKPTLQLLLASKQRSLIDKYFQSVCELDIMFNLEKTHFILDEMYRSCCSVRLSVMHVNVLKLSNAWLNEAHASCSSSIAQLRDLTVALEAYSSISSLTRVNTQCINCFRRPLEKERAAVAAAATR
eukprot:7376-Heterococcus_DN1.PRE.9